MTAPTITVAPGIEIERSMMLQYVGDFHIPGEQVRLDASTRFIGEDEDQRNARVEAFKERILTISETRIDPALNGKGAILNYVFEGVDGRHNARAFSDPQPCEHIYGMLIRRDGQTWFAPLSGVMGSMSVGTPLRIKEQLPRSACYSFGVAEPILVAHGMYERDGRLQSEVGDLEQLTVEGFFRALEDEPMTGEFVIGIGGAGDDDRTLVYAPWTSDCSPEEVAKAEVAIRAWVESENTAEASPRM